MPLYAASPTPHQPKDYHPARTPNIARDFPSIRWSEIRLSKLALKPMCLLESTKVILVQCPYRLKFSPWGHRS